MNEAYIFSEILDLCIKYKLKCVDDLIIYINHILSQKPNNENIIKKLQKLTKDTDFSYETMQVNSSINDDSIMMKMEIS